MKPRSRVIFSPVPSRTPASLWKLASARTSIPIVRNAIAQVALTPISTLVSRRHSTIKVLIYGAVNSFLNDSNDRVVVPGDLTHSLLYNRANRVDAYEMPPLAKNVVDTNAVTTIAAWINSLPTGPGVALTTPASSVIGDFSVTSHFHCSCYRLDQQHFAISNGTITSLPAAARITHSPYSPRRPRPGGHPTTR